MLAPRMVMAPCGGVSWRSGMQEKTNGSSMGAGVHLCTLTTQDHEKKNRAQMRTSRRRLLPQNVYTATTAASPHLIVGLFFVVQQTKAFALVLICHLKDEEAVLPVANQVPCGSVIAAFKIGHEVRSIDSYADVPWSKVWTKKGKNDIYHYRRCCFSLFPPQDTSFPEVESACRPIARRTWTGRTSLERVVVLRRLTPRGEATGPFGLPCLCIHP